MPSFASQRLSPQLISNRRTENKNQLLLNIMFILRAVGK